MTRIVRLVVAVVALLVGVVWIGQGLGLIGGSAMSDQPIWAVVGAGLVVIAGWLGWSARRPTVPD